MTTEVVVVVVVVRGVVVVVRTFVLHEGVCPATRTVALKFGWKNTREQAPGVPATPSPP